MIRGSINNLHILDKTFFLTRRMSSGSYLSCLLEAKYPYSCMYPFPKTVKSEEMEELNMVVDNMKRFLKENNDPNMHDEKGVYDAGILKQLKEFGAFGIQVPEEYNGLAFNNTKNAKLLESLGTDLSLAVILGAHQSIGYKGIMLYGNEDQKKKYLPKLATGENIAAFALTEASAGSDAASIKAKATLSEDGNYYILNGGKIWISNGDEAEIFTVFAKTIIEGKEKINAFIVERAFGGVTNGPSEKKLGIKSVHSVVVNFDNVKVPKENLLGEPGNGFKIAMGILNSGRFGMAALLTTVQKEILKKALEGVKDRVQFGKKLVEFQDIQNKLACMASDIYITEAMTYMISGSMDKGYDVELEAAMSKVFSSEAAWHNCDECIQMHGGMGFMSENDCGRILRDLRIFRIFEGTNDILRQFVILTALRRMDKELLNLLKIIAGPIDTSHIEDKLVDSKETKLLRSYERKFCLAVTRGLMKFKKDIINEQVYVRLLSDFAIGLYSAAVVSSRFYSNENPKLEEIDLYKFTMKRCFLKMDAIKENLRNYFNYNKLISKIGTDVVRSEGYKAVHPLEL